MAKYIIGVDEAGRGPLAGPVSIAAVCIREDIYRQFLSHFKEARDSKKVAPLRREKIVADLKNKIGNGAYFSVTLVHNKTIDKKGIVKALQIGVLRTLYKLEINPRKTRILLDGSLKAPKEFKDQKTIINGDDKVKIISLASIVAKVHRDKHMRIKAKKYPEYLFDVHKGYGTKIHRQMIEEFGPSDIHRMTFLKNLKI